MAYNLETASKVAYLLVSGRKEDANLRLMKLALEAISARLDVKLPKNLPGVMQAVDEVFEFFIELGKAKEGDNSFAQYLNDEKIQTLVASSSLFNEAKTILSNLTFVSDPNVKQYVENTIPDIRQIISYENLARLRQEGLAAGK